MEAGDPRWARSPRVTSGHLHLSCKRDHIKMTDNMDRQVTPPKPVTSPTLGPPPPYQQAPTYCN